MLGLETQQHTVQGDPTPHSTPHPTPYPNITSSTVFNAILNYFSIPFPALWFTGGNIGGISSDKSALTPARGFRLDCDGASLDCDDTSTDVPTDTLLLGVLLDGNGTSLGVLLDCDGTLLGVLLDFDCNGEDGGISDFFSSSSDSVAGVDGDDTSTDRDGISIGGRDISIGSDSTSLDCDGISSYTLLLDCDGTSTDFDGASLDGDGISIDGDGVLLSIPSSCKVGPRVSNNTQFAIITKPNLVFAL